MSVALSAAMVFSMGMTSVLGKNEQESGSCGTTITIPVEKKWEGDTTDTSTRPNSIVVKLSNGSNIVAETTLTATNDWKGTFQVKDHTQGAKYSVKEESVDGYTPSYKQPTITCTSNMEDTIHQCNKLMININWNSTSNNNVLVVKAKGDNAHSYILTNCELNSTEKNLLRLELSKLNGFNIDNPNKPAEFTTKEQLEKMGITFTENSIDFSEHNDWQMVTYGIFTVNVQGAVVTNTYSAPTPQTGSLSITKQTVGETDNKKTYTINVTFTGTSIDSLAYTISPADSEAESSKTWTSENSSIILKAGQTATFSSIPAGTTYTVTEEEGSANGYNVTYQESDTTETNASDGTGTIAANDNDTVTVTNTRSIPGTLTVTKSVPNYVIAGETFEINVTFGNHFDSTPSGSAGGKEWAPYANKDVDYTIGNVSYTGKTDDNGKLSINLKAGESVTFTKIPIGTEYTVSETANADFYTTYAKSQNPIQVAECSEIDYTQPVNGVISENTADTVTVTNTRKTGGELTVEKKVVDENCSPVSGDTTRFSFTVTANANVFPVTNENADGNTYTNQTTFNLKHGDTKVLPDLPLGITYHVEEAAVKDYTASYSAESVTLTANATSPVAEATVTVTNTKSSEPTADVYIYAHKQLDGQAPNGEKFNFVLTDEVNASGNVIANAENEGGDITFGPISLKKGKYAFYMSEVKGTDSTIVYDESEYRIEVSVVEEDGVLSAIVTYPQLGVAERAAANDPPIFNNTTNSGNTDPDTETVSFTPTAIKTLDGGTPLDRSFRFTLQQNGQVIDTAYNKGQSVVFSTITYNEAGTYTYFIQEDYTYSNGYEYTNVGFDYSIYKAIVEVKADGNGKLSASFTYYDDDHNIVMSPKFENTT